MNNINNCICQKFNEMAAGTIVTVQLVNLTQYTFVFDKKDLDAIHGKLNDGNIIILDCKEILSVMCKPDCTPAITINNPGQISCNGNITGRVACNGFGLAGVTVNLTSNPNIVLLGNQAPVTDNNGNFTSTVIIPSQTQPTPVQITATVIIEGRIITNDLTIIMDCFTCQNPNLTLNVSNTTLLCNTASISGMLTCNSTPIPNAIINFVVTPNDNVQGVPNPTTTNGTGNYSSTLTPLPGASGSYTIQASTNIGGTVINSPTISFTANCPATVCTCKGSLSSSGRNQPPAIITVNGTPLTGQLNISLIECAASINQICNPNIDNFEFTYNAGNGNNYQFTQGRRISFTCIGNTATLIGVAQGAINNGPKTSYNVTIIATLNNNNTITWTINATNGSNTFSTMTPWTANASPNSFIAIC